MKVVFHSPGLPVLPPRPDRQRARDMDHRLLARAVRPVDRPAVRSSDAPRRRPPTPLWLYLFPTDEGISLQWATSAGRCFTQLDKMSFRYFNNRTFSPTPAGHGQESVSKTRPGIDYLIQDLSGVLWTDCRKSKMVTPAALWFPPGTRDLLRRPGIIFQEFKVVGGLGVA